MFCHQNDVEHKSSDGDDFMKHANHNLENELIAKCIKEKSTLANKKIPYRKRKICGKNTHFLAQQNVL